MKKLTSAADYIRWDEAQEIINNLISENKPKMAAFVTCGCYLLLRYSDIVQLKWEDLEDDSVTIREKKTKKIRTITFSDEFKETIAGIKGGKEYKGLIFTNQFTGGIMSAIYFNAELKRLKKRFKIKCENISCHSLRKTGARRIYDISGKNEHALILLSEILRHSSISCTRIYISLQKEEIAAAYRSL